jgi:hypothetical protein
VGAAITGGNVVRSTSVIARVVVDDPPLLVARIVHDTDAAVAVGRDPSTICTTPVVRSRPKPGGNDGGVTTVYSTAGPPPLIGLLCGRFALAGEWMSNVYEGML